MTQPHPKGYPPLDISSISSTIDLLQYTPTEGNVSLNEPPQVPSAPPAEIRPSVSSQTIEVTVSGGGLDHKLPEAVEGLREGRMRSCEAAAVAVSQARRSNLTDALIAEYYFMTQAALFAGIEVAILNLEKTPGQGSGGHQLMLFLSYLALFLNASITVTSILLIDRLGGLPFWTMNAETKVTVTSQTSGRRLLARFGARGWAWNFIEFQWFIALALGCFVFFAQVLVYIWIHEGIGLRIAATVVGILSALPLFSIFFAET